MQKTTRGALALKMPVTVLSGAHATYESDGKTAQQVQKGIDEELAAAGAKVVKWEDVVASWETQYSK